MTSTGRLAAIREDSNTASRRSFLVGACHCNFEHWASQKWIRSRTCTFVLWRTKGSLCLLLFDLVGGSVPKGCSLSKTSGSTSRAGAFPFVFLLTIGKSAEVGGVGDDRECGVVMACRTGETEDDLLGSSASESEETGLETLRVRRCTRGDPGGCSWAELT